MEIFVGTDGRLLVQVNDAYYSLTPDDMQYAMTQSRQNIHLGDCRSADARSQEEHTMIAVVDDDGGFAIP